MHKITRFLGILTLLIILIGGANINNIWIIKSITNNTNRLFNPIQIVAASTSGATLVIHVIDFSGKPLERMYIGNIFDRDAGKYIENTGGLTNADGIFTILNLPAARYSLLVTGNHYGATDKIIQLSEGQSLSVIYIMYPEGFIAGIVKFRNGTAVVNNYLDAYPEPDSYAYVTHTDSSGAFKFDRLVPGTYEIRVLKPGLTQSTGATEDWTIVKGIKVEAGQTTSGIEIIISGNPSLSAIISADPSSGMVPLTVQFHSVISGGTPPYSYSWNFGDGSPESVLQNTTHTFTKTGSYTATFTVNDSIGTIFREYLTCVTYAETTSSSVLVSFMNMLGSLIANIGNFFAFLTFQTFVGIVSISVGFMGIYSFFIRSRTEKKRQEVLFENYREKIDEVYRRFKMNSRECEAELIKLRGTVMDDFKDGKIEPRSYDFLITRIKEYIDEIIEQKNQDKKE